MKTKYSVQELDAMLASISDEVSSLYKSESLSKAFPAEEPDEASEGSEGPTAPADAGPEVPTEQSLAAPPVADEEIDHPSELDGGADAPVEDAGMEGADDGAIEPAPTVDQLMAEYGKLDPEALKMHYLACKGAIMAIMGQGAEDGQGAAPEAEMAPPGAPAPEASAAPALKAETAASAMPQKDGNGSLDRAVEKSEKAEIARLTALLAKQELAVVKVAELLSKPLRKSVQNISDLQFRGKDGATQTSKAQDLSKSEITSQLRSKARENLNKSDRDLITEYALGHVDVSKIDHLLK